MTEVPTPPPEFPPVPYERIAAYTASLRGIPPMHNVAMLWSGGRRVGTEKDVALIDGRDGLSVVLKASLTGSALATMVDLLADHLDIATTGSPYWRDDPFYYFSSEESIASFREDYPQDSIDDVDAPMNRLYPVFLHRKSGNEERSDLVLFFSPRRKEKYEGRDYYNYLSFRFFDPNPVIAQFVARLALLGFPPPRIESSE